MKKIASIILVASIVMTGICSCSKKAEPEKEETYEPSHVAISKTVNTKEVDMSELIPDIENQQEIEPSISQIRNICQLATLQVYFHNVAKSIKQPGTGMSGFNQVPRRFWVEYSGSAELGIDMSRVDMEIVGNEINITLPPVEMIGDIQVDSSSYSAGSVIVEDEDWYRRSNEITADDMTGAIYQSNEAVKADILSDNMVMLQAEDRAKELIENYVNQLASLSGKDYTINWVYTETN